MYLKYLYPGIPKLFPDLSFSVFPFLSLMVDGSTINERNFVSDGDNTAIWVDSTISLTASLNPSRVVPFSIKLSER